jgi:hypothetical protein
MGAVYTQKPYANGFFTLYMRGAPEQVWKLCNRILAGADGECVDMTPDHQKAYDGMYEHMASRGHRVLGFAKLLLPGDEFPEGFVLRHADFGLVFNRYILEAAKRKDKKPIPRRHTRSVPRRFLFRSSRLSELELFWRGSSLAGLSWYLLKNLIPHTIDFSLPH